MDFELSSDQTELQVGVKRLLAGRFAPRTLPAMVAEGIDRRRWVELADAGVFSLRLPESNGGVGLGMAEAALVFEQIGASLIPGPVLATELAGHLMPAAARGEAVVGLVERRPGPMLIEHGAGLDHLLVVDDDGVWALSADQVSGRSVDRPIDPLTPLLLVDSLPRGEPVAEPARFRLEGTVLAAALLAGAAQAVTELTVRYALEREQFGRPIGGFQAVKHILADMAVRSAVGQSAVYAAAVTLDDPAIGDPVRAASAAKVTAGAAAIRNGKDAIQVHGGMGFTWEVDAHLYLKRAWMLDTQFGSVDEHSDTMARLM